MTETAVKRQQDTPDSDPPLAKRQKVKGRSLDAGGSLALEHLLHDDTTHPLYQRNAEHVIDTIVDRDALTDLIAQPFTRCLGQQLFSVPHLDPRKVELAKQTLVNSLSKVVLAALGAQIASVYNVNKMRNKLDVVEEAKGYRVELGLFPVVECADDAAEAGPSNGGVSTGEEEAASAERRAARRAKKQREPTAQNASRVVRTGVPINQALAPYQKRRSVRGCAIQRSTERRSTRGGYSEEDQDEEANDQSSSSESSDSEEAENSNDEDEY